MANTEATVHVEMSPEFRARLTDLGEQLRRMQECLEEVEMRQGVAEAAHHLLVKGLARHLERFNGDDMKIKLGATYRDTILGQQGVATSSTRYITGCDRACIEWLDGDGKVKSAFLDVNRLLRVVDVATVNVPLAMTDGVDAPG